jgi:hypothetical protein
MRRVIGRRRYKALIGPRHADLVIRRKATRSIRGVDKLMEKKNAVTISGWSRPGATAPSRDSYRAYGRHINQEIQMPKAGGSLR